MSSSLLASFSCTPPPQLSRPLSRVRLSSSSSLSSSQQQSRIRSTRPNVAASTASGDFTDGEWASTAGAGLERAGAEFAAAAAVLGENQVLNENPAALSMIGCGLSNAGRALSDATLEADWMRDGEVGMLLSGAAGDLASAAAAVGPTSVAESETALTAAADALDDAGSSIETAGCGCGGDGGDAAVTDNLSRAGACLRGAASAVDEAAACMASAAPRDSPSATAARHLSAASQALSSAGLGLMTQASRAAAE